MSNNNPANIPLTQKEMLEISQAYARLQHLRTATIKQPNDDAEIKGLVEYLAPVMLDHASEFIGCWFVLHNEYEPLINVAAPFFRRVISLIQESERKYAESQRSSNPPPDTAAPSNVVGLDGNPTEQ